ncbi:MAG TPA: tetratricopeptide repeat protein [Thermoanaerobaculia bacterium]|nr:tetratricopeptide repeat protein [Thermoanaerobaculia bacterium]
MKKHPTDLHLEGLFLSQDRERRKILLHIAECPRCRERIEDILHGQRERPGVMPDGSEESGRDETEPGLGGLSLPLVLILKKERVDAPELFVELLRTPAEHRAVLLRTSARFHTWGFYELLVERSLETATRDPNLAEELGRLAFGLSDRLDANLYGAEVVEDLRGRAWAFIANARRVRSDLAGADEAFLVARSHLRKGTQDPLEIAVLLDLEASLRRAQRRFDESERLLRQAAEIFLRHDDPHRSGRSLVKLSTVHYFAGNLEEALADLRRSLDLLDVEQEPRLRLCAQHNLIWYLTEAGHFEEARGVYRETRPLYRDFAEPWVQNRRKWVRGRILRGLGHLVPAESLLLTARDGFLAEGIPYDTALVSLEIATLYAEQGRTTELKRLAGEMVPIFSSLHIHREALAALAFLTQAIEAEAAGLEIVKSVADYLRRAANEPELRFQEPEIRG